MKTQIEGAEPEPSVSAIPEATEPAADGAEQSGLIDAILEAPLTRPQTAPAPLDVPLAAMRTARLVSVAGRKATITLRGARAPVDAEIAPEVAEIVVVPTPVDWARPWEPAAFEICANPRSLEHQVTDVVRSRVVESLYVPIAVYGCDRPFAIASRSPSPASRASRTRATRNTS